jgi:hypothetical protein
LFSELPRRVLLGNLLTKEQENKEGRSTRAPPLFLFVGFFLGEAYGLEYVF